MAGLHRFMFERAVEGIYEHPLGGGFRIVNPAMARILGYAEPAELLRLSPDELTRIYVQPGRR